MVLGATAALPGLPQAERAASQDEGLLHLRQALEVDPQDADVLYNLGLLEVGIIASGQCFASWQVHIAEPGHDALHLHEFCQRLRQRAGKVGTLLGCLRRQASAAELSVCMPGG